VPPESAVTASAHGVSTSRCTYDIGGAGELSLSVIGSAAIGPAATSAAAAPSKVRLSIMSS
jgi:hypothetical protein